MAGQALYRKYRSRDFTEVIGQDHVVRTLTTAIGNGRLSHAYLFTGPRGTGKTSVARLLARALNCTGETKPCNQCATCQAAINSSLDIIEIDAASNRSIDAVRELREKVGLAPTQGQYKVYIIDEVHMLTTEAFNALLKTLEEPPSHAVFILATTEAHKLPETIISRTQRFTFKPITTADIQGHLGVIAKQEGLNVEPAALEIIAIAARGGFRDAIGLLDQLGASGESPVTAASVRLLLGYSDAEEIAALSRAIAAGQSQPALEVLARLETQGAQPGQVTLQLAELWRSVLLAGSGVANTDPVTKELAAAVPPARTARIVETLLEVTRSHWPQLALEAAIVGLTAAPEPAPTPSTTTAAPRRVASTTAKPAAKAAPADPEPEAPIGSTLSADLWPKVLVLIKPESNSLCALLQMYPVDFGADQVTIKPRFNFHRDLFIKPANRSIIEAAAAKVYGRAVKVTAQTDDSAQPGRPAAKPSAASLDPSSELMSSALEILGGEVVD